MKAKKTQEKEKEEGAPKEEVESADDDDEDLMDSKDIFEYKAPASSLPSLVFISSI